MALYVKKHFAKELVKLASYKSKCYKEALEEAIRKRQARGSSPLPLEKESEHG